MKNKLEQGWPVDLGKFEALRSTPEGRKQLRQQLDRAMKAWARDPIIPVRQRPEFQISPQLRNRRIIR